MTSIETQAGARSAGISSTETGFGHAWRLAVQHAVATGLQGASAMLGRLAVQLAATPTGRAAQRQRQPQVEFHAEAGAPEGALYVDGRLIGWLDGVTRL